MNGSPIDDYIADVARHLKLRGPARKQALADLRESLTEAPELASTSSPADYASALDEQFGTTEGAFPTILGMPVSLIHGLGRRMAETFNPADERLLVPRVLGAGWAVNMGAVAVRLGLLRPDDVDDEVLADATKHLGTTRAVALVPIAAAAVSTAVLWSRRHQIARVSGKNQAANLIFGTLIPLTSAALAVASTNRETPAAQRLTMPAIAAGLATMTTGETIQLTVKPDGQAIVLTAIGVGGACELLLSYWPVRKALQRRWHSDLAPQE